MRVRWWPFIANARVASTRIRCLQVIEGLRKRGVDAGLYSRGSIAPDILVLSKRYDEASLSVAIKLQKTGTRIVLDLCDNHFYAAVPSADADRRAERLRAAMGVVDAVVVSTPALAEIVRSECPNLRTLYVIGDAFEPAFYPDWWTRIRHPVDEVRYARFKFRIKVESPPAAARLLWFGHHGNGHAAGGMDDLLEIAPVLNELGPTVSLTVISNNLEKYNRIRAALSIQSFYLPWSRTTFSRAAKLHDIAVIPVRMDPFTSCKTNNRMATSILHGLAVAADPVPSYLEFSDAAVLNDWSHGLTELCRTPAMRQGLLANGDARLQKNWTLQTIAGLWQDTLEMVKA
jgi:hypothetical protein